MKITFLGTGTSQGVPVITCKCKTCRSTDERDKRLRTSLLIQDKQTNIIIDAGPDFRQQVLRSGIRHLDGILITHGHKDHVGGLDDVRAFNYTQRKAMNVYAGNFTFPDLQREFYYAFEQDKYPGVPEINLVEVNGKKFSINQLEIQSILTEHSNTPTLAYRLGKLTYITDTKRISEEEFEKIKGTEYLIINALRKEPHFSHFNLEEALAMIERIAPKKAYLTHISHLMGTHEEVSKELPENVVMAYDGLSFDL